MNPLVIVIGVGAVVVVVLGFAWALCVVAKGADEVMADIQRADAPLRSIGLGGGGHAR